jgi:hypothetical protein
MTRTDTSGIARGMRATATGAERAAFAVVRRAVADFVAFLAAARTLGLERTAFDVFLAAFAAAARATLVDRPLLFAECLLMFMNIAAYFHSVGSFLTNLSSFYKALRDKARKC